MKEPKDMKMTLRLSKKLSKEIEYISKNTDFKTKTGIIRKAVYVYAYLLKKRKLENCEIVAIDKNNKVVFLSPLFDL